MTFQKNERILFDAAAAAVVAAAAAGGIIVVVVAISPRSGRDYRPTLFREVEEDSMGKRWIRQGLKEENRFKC